VALATIFYWIRFETSLFVGSYDSQSYGGGMVYMLMTPVYIYATDRKEGYVVRKLQRGLGAIETLCERWNINISEDVTQTFYFSHRLRLPEAHLTMNGRNIPFVNHIKYLGVIFDKRIT
jgi:hypothetical protein